MGGRGAKSGAKITEKALDKSEKSGIIGVGSDETLEQAKSRDKKIEITDIAIEKTEAPDIPYFTTEQNQKFKELNRELLRKAKNENDSNEVAFLFDPNTLSFEYEFGDVNSVNVTNNPLARDMLRTSDDKSLFLLHNHPSTKTFSYSDIGVLLTYNSLGGMTAVSNAGVVNTVYKSSRYDFDKAFVFISDLRSLYPSKLSETDDGAIVKQFLKAGRDFGIELL